jgi:hypothetical protein
MMATFRLETSAVIRPARTLTISTRPRTGQLLDLVRALTDHEGDVVLWQGSRAVCVVKHPSGCCIWI